MNRRNFAKSVLGTVGLSAAVVGGAVAKISSEQKNFTAGEQLKTDDGLKMTLSQHSFATVNKDHKQFVLTFDVNNPNDQLAEKIYHLTDQSGQKHQVYMTPIDKNQLQALFNWRTNA